MNCIQKAIGRQLFRLPDPVWARLPRSVRRLSVHAWWAR